MKKRKNIIKKLSIGIIIIIFILLLNSLFIDYRTQSIIFNTTQNAPSHTVWLVFGTSKLTPEGTPNIFFTTRINRATELYKSGIIKYILVSGDNSKKSYDEPTDFQQALIEKGIPKQDIVLDYAWFSTWDSVARATSVFNAPDLLLISQRFQVQRALMACIYFKLDCHAIPAKDIPFSVAPRVYLREYGARLKLWYDRLFPTPYIGGELEPVPWNR